jgi:hypothetical protein
MLHSSRRQKRRPGFNSLPGKPFGREALLNQRRDLMNDPLVDFGLVGFPQAQPVAADAEPPLEIDGGDTQGTTEQLQPDGGRGRPATEANGEAGLSLSSMTAGWSECRYWTWTRAWSRPESSHPHSRHVSPFVPVHFTKMQLALKWNSQASAAEATIHLKPPPCTVWQRYTAYRSRIFENEHEHEHEHE